MAGTTMDKTVEQELPLTRRAGVPPMVMWLLGAYVLIMPVAEAAIHWDFQITQDRSRFAVVNAITLTGFQSSVAVEGYERPGQVAVFALTLMGTLFSMVVGGLAVARIIRLPYTDRQILTWAVWVCAVFTAVGAIPLIEGGQSPMEAAMLSLSALGNSGLAFGELPGVLSWQTHGVLLPLSIVGGLGLPVLMELSDAVWRGRRLSVHSRTVLTMTAGVYVVLFGVCAILQGVEGSRSWVEVMGSSSVAAVNGRTTGFAFEFAPAFPRGMQWVVLVGMILGGSPAGTAGGVKTTTLVELYRGVRKALRGEAVGRSFGIAATWVAVYGAMVVGVMVLLLSVVPQLGADRLLFETVSALSNAGLSYGTIMIVGPGLDVLSVAMLLGRLVPLGILWWMAQTTEDAEVAVG